MRRATSLALAVTVAAALTTGVTVASAVPAIAVQADDVGTLTNKTVEASGGKMTFIDDGDVFEICDTRVNGESVYGALFYSGYLETGFRRVMTTEDGGDAGCDKKGHNIGNDGHYIMVICDGRYPTSIFEDGNCDASGSFNE